jgi:hypothetical protein
MSTSFGKDPQNPRDGGDGEGGKWPEVIKETIIGGGSSNIRWGGAIKHLSDPHNPRWPTGGGGSKCSTAFSGTNEGNVCPVIKAEKQVVIGCDHDITEDVVKVAITKTGGRIPVIWKEYDLKDGDSGSVIIEVGGDHDSNDPWVIEDPTDTIDQEDWFGPPDGKIEYDTRGVILGGWGARDTNIPKHEVPKQGDDQYDARCASEHSGKRYTGRTKEWLGGSQLGRTTEDINGGEGLDHEWYIDGDFYISQKDWFGPATGPNPVPNGGEGGYIEGDYGFSGDWGFSGVWDKQDPTWVSGHTNSFSGDWGI